MKLPLWERGHADPHRIAVGRPYALVLLGGPDALCHAIIGRHATLQGAERKRDAFRIQDGRELYRTDQFVIWFARDKWADPM
jgi:hypothetical protein